MPNQNISQTVAPFDDSRFWGIEPAVSVGIFELGTPRDQVLSLLQNESIELDDRDLDSAEVYVQEMETTLHFSDSAPHPLLLIEVDDDRVRLGASKVLGESAHNVLASVPSNSTLWFNDLIQITDPGSKRAATKRQSDSELLKGGTLWIANLGIWLSLVDGTVVTLLLCDPHNLPNDGNGEFTTQQRLLSEPMRPGINRLEVLKVHPVHQMVKVVLAVIALSSVGYFGKQAWEEQKKWDNAPEVEAEVVERWPPPPEPLPSRYTLSYQDTTGGVHRVHWGQQDVYQGMPHVGDKVTLRYLADAPEIAMGPAKLQDVGLRRFAPYLIGTFAVYFVLSLVVHIVLTRLLP